MKRYSHTFRGFTGGKLANVIVGPFPRRMHRMHNETVIILYLQNNNLFEINDMYVCGVADQN